MKLNPRPAIPAALLPMLLASCAVNPATGERQLILISESREIELGRTADASIVAQMGLYSDSSASEYVDRVGRRLQTVAERPNLPWTFRLVDDPIVNAFALPGGFVYITRGIMVHLNNEAQLAAVIGHEIGHVTGRHGAEQMSRSQIAQVGLGVGSVISPTAATISGIAGSGLGLLFLRYGRDDERQADELGLRYMTDASYDAREMPDVFTMLAGVTAAAGGSSVPNWLSTHPDPGDRHDRIEAEIDSSGVDFSGRDVAQDEYLAVIDGMVYGPNPREGYFEGSLFLHPDMAFQLRFPEGWATQNQRSAVVGVNEAEDLMIQLKVAGTDTPRQAARLFLSGERIEGRMRDTDINGIPTVRINFTASTADGSPIAGQANFIDFDGTVITLMGFGTASAWDNGARAVRRNIESFDRLRDRAALDVQPMRLVVVSVPRTMSLGEYLDAEPAAIDQTTIALLNQRDLTDVLRRGTRIKTILRR